MVPERASDTGSPWSSESSFRLNARPSGTQVTVAHRMKAILFTLVRTFEFELAVPVSEIGSKSTMVQRPVLRSDPNRPQLPLLIKPYKQS